ncbi:MAG TPA: flagellar basal-body MS-ring/collar protein FliF [Rubrivivax sp.]
METAIANPAPQTLIPAPGSLGARLAALPAKPLLMLGAGLAALIAVAIALALNGPRGDYKVLFAGLSDKDGGAVIAQLSQMNVPYRHSEGGGAILVPADKVHDVRMKLGLAGLPKSATGGYELLDTPRFGQTQAGENVSIKRATEGELMKTIGSLSAVHSARVMLALPAQNGFFREQQKPSASVQVTLHPGRTLDRAQLAGIVHLVSASVPDLNPKAVSVVDGSGTLLTAQEGNKGEGLDAQQLQYVQQIESGLHKNVVALLEPVLGRENLRATVAAEVDFSETLQVSEEFKPNQGTASAAVKVQQTLESSQPGAGVPSGVPGAQSNQPPREASAPINGSTQALQAAQGGNAGGANTRRESTTNYEVDKTQRTTRNAMGTVKRLSAAVVVNHRVTTDAKGKTTSTALTSDEVEKLTALVQQGVGFNKERGDTVRVINAPFRSEPAPSAEDTPTWQQPWLQDLLRSLAAPAALAFVALLIVLTLIRPALTTLLAPVPAPAPGSQLSAVVDDPQQLPGAPAPAGTVLAIEAPVVNPRLVQARAIAKEHPAAVANMVRAMIHGQAGT